MRFAVDAHAIGRHLTGNEVYVRSLLNGFAGLDRESEFITYLSMEDAESWVPARFPVRRIAGNPFHDLPVVGTRSRRANRTIFCAVLAAMPSRSRA